MMKLDDKIVKLIEYMGYDKRFIKSVYFEQRIEGEAGDFFEEVVLIRIAAHRGHSQDIKIGKKIEIPDSPYSYVEGEERT